MGAAHCCRSNTGTRLEIEGGGRGDCVKMWPKCAKKCKKTLAVRIFCVNLPQKKGKMVTQKAISARIENEILWDIDQEVQLGVTNRNRILNEGARLWLYLRDLRRSYSAIDDEEARRKMLRGFLRLWFPEALD